MELRETEISVVIQIFLEQLAAGVQISLLAV